MLKKKQLLLIIGLSIISGCAMPYESVPDKTVNDQKYESAFSLEKVQYQSACENQILDNKQDCAKRKATLDTKGEAYAKRLNELNPEFKLNEINK